jgi:hypothetical protein
VLARRVRETLSSAAKRLTPNPSRRRVTRKLNAAIEKLPDVPRMDKSQIKVRFGEYDEGMEYDDDKTEKDFWQTRECSGDRIFHDFAENLYLRFSRNR